MKSLYKNKAVSLYETRMSRKYIVCVAVCYVIAIFLCYAVGVVAPYVATVTVSERDNLFLTRAALSATEAQKTLPAAQKERALLMPTGEDSFLRRLKLVEDAQSSIDYMVFATFESEYPYIFHGALLKAADRGVKVRVIFDGKSGRLDGKLETIEKLLCEHKNIEMYYFNPTDIFSPSGLMVLMHDKVMIVDGKTMIVGGANMGNGPYLMNFDVEVMITNGANGSVATATRYFERMIGSDLAKRVKSSGKKDEKTKNKYIAKFDEYFGKSDYANREIDYLRQGTPVDRVTFLSNKITDGKKSPLLWQALCNLSQTSEKSLFVSPYILLDENKKRKMRELAATNDKFTLITNSLYNTRNVAYADYNSTRECYIDRNIELLEYQNKDQLHAKLASFDDRFSVIGSCNLDERSIHIDTESLVIIDSPEFNKQLNDCITKNLIDNSLQVGSDGKYIEKPNVKAGKVPQSKNILYTLCNVMSIIRCLI